MIGRATPAERLIKILNAQRSALLRGDIGSATAQEHALGAAVSDLSGSEVDATMLSMIQNAAQHNARLLQAAKSGLARARADRSAQKTAPFQTYAADGRIVRGAPNLHQMLSRR